MQLEVYDKYTRVRLNLINMVKYVQYTKKFNGVGTFELKVPINEASLVNLVEGNYIYFESGIVGVIKYKDKETSESTEVIIKGYTVNYLLSYRSFLKTSNYKNEIAKITQNMVKDLCITNSDSRRNITCIALADITPASPTAVVQKTGVALNVAIEDLLSTIEYGYELSPKIVEYSESLGTNIESFQYKVIKPVDRTINNTEGNNPVVFSLEMNNLSKMSFIEDSTKYSSVAIVAGEGEGESRTIVETGDVKASGIDRIELYVDARDLQSTSNQSSMSSTDYTQLLQKRGQEKLINNSKFITFDGSVLSNKNTSFRYLQDFFLGDYVTLIDRQMNLQFDLQITEITKTLTESGEELLDVKFGKDRITVQELIKRGGILNG